MSGVVIMTSQIVVLNRQRSFILSDSALTLEDYKTYVNQEKVFKISDEHSAVVLVSEVDDLQVTGLKI